MHISEKLKNTKPSFSFEFFPPKTPESSKRLYDTIKNLVPLQPNFVSVTYGAGGSTRHLTHELVVKLQGELPLTVVAHLTCVGATKDKIYTILSEYDAAGVTNIMALRGDPPNDQDVFVPEEKGFPTATELVAFIKEHFPHMGVGCAGFPEGHPETPNRLLEMTYLKQKVDAGADYICTQLFFDNRDYVDFCDRCRLAGITIPIIAGIMPINSKKGMSRTSELALGARIPAALLRAVTQASSDEEVERIGIDWAIKQVADLLKNDVDGIHFYTLNQSKATLKIYQELNLKVNSI